MIIISLDYAVTLAPEDANNPLIGYKNVATSSNLASTTEDTFFPLVNLANPTTFQPWKGTDADSNEVITFTGDGSDIDYVGIAAHNFGSTGRTVGITATLDGDPVTLISPILITSDEPLLFRFANAPYSEIEITISADADDTTPPQAAVLFIGELLVAQRRIYVGHTPINYGRQSNVVVGRSTNGNFLGRLVLGEKRVTSVQLNNLTPAWYRTYFEPFVAAAVAEPFFFAWRPGSYPLEVGYCWATGDIVPSNALSNGMMSVSMDLEGIV